MRRRNPVGKKFGFAQRRSAPVRPQSGDIVMLCRHLTDVGTQAATAFYRAPAGMEVEGFNERTGRVDTVPVNLFALCADCEQIHGRVGRFTQVPWGGVRNWVEDAPESVMNPEPSSDPADVLDAFGYAVSAPRTRRGRVERCEDEDDTMDPECGQVAVMRITSREDGTSKALCERHAARAARHVIGRQGGGRTRSRSRLNPRRH